ncbi:MAG: enoyl-CoA hydratase [Alicyclobacillaceae bacterium]|nr:enoyl-CoA hydratase [Alicyclobacillaceae bacterium]
MTQRTKVQWTKEEGYAVITIDNPPLNVMSEAVARELGECVEEVAADGEVVAVIVTGAGTKAFMAGADIKEFPSRMKPGAAGAMSRELQKVLNRLDDLEKPTIAAILGYALGGGCELALACDIRIAGKSAQLGLPEIKLGLFPGAGGTQRLPRLVGEAKAKELMFTGDPISAEEALRIGLVNRVVPDDQVMEAAKDLAKTIASRTLVSLSRIKRLVDQGLERPLKEALEYEADLFDEVFQTEDVKEGVQAFLEKRAPKFKHR